MKPWMKRSVGAVGAVLGGAVVASALGSVAWSRTTELMLEHLADTPSNGGPTVFSPDELQSRARSSGSSRKGDGSSGGDAS